MKHIIAGVNLNHRESPLEIHVNDLFELGNDSPHGTLHGVPIEEEKLGDEAHCAVCLYPSAGGTTIELTESGARKLANAVTDGLLEKLANDVERLTRTNNELSRDNQAARERTDELERALVKARTGGPIPSTPGTTA